MVLTPCSERLRAQADHPWWPQAGQLQQEQEQKERAPKRLCTRTAAASAAQAPADSSVPLPALAGRPLLAVPLEGPHEVEPAMEVIRHMYTGVLQPGLSVTQLLMTRKLAQYLLCPSCADACAAALSATTDVPYSVVATVCSTPHLACMLEDAALQGFVASCASALCQQFGSTLAIVRSNDLISAFGTLPMALVMLLLAPDTAQATAATRLSVDCEESVLLVLHHWVQANKPHASTTKQLRKLLRPMQLSPAYLQYVLPTLEWLGLTPPDLADLGFAAIPAAIHRGTLPAGASEQLFRRLRNTGIFKEEPQWLCQRIADNSSSQHANSGFPATLSAMWSREQLQQFLNKARAGAGKTTSVRCGPGVQERVYAGGYIWSLLLLVEGSCAAAAGPVVAGPGAAAAVEAQPATRSVADACIMVRSDLPIPFAGGIKRCISSLVRAVVRLQRAGRGPWQAVLDHPFFDKGMPRGFIFWGQDALDVASWQPFLVDGAVRATATLEEEEEEEEEEEDDEEEEEEV